MGKIKLLSLEHLFASKNAFMFWILLLGAKHFKKVTMVWKLNNMRNGKFDKVKYNLFHNLKAFQNNICKFKKITLCFLKFGC